MKRIVVLLAAFFTLNAKAALPDYQIDPANGGRLLLWVHSERGRTGPEARAGSKLAQQGVTVWSLDLAAAYFLPQLPSSMDRVPVGDLAEWLEAALASGKPVTVYAVARAAVPLLRAAARLDRAGRGRLCLLLMHPNLYASAEALADAAYVDPGRLDGLRVRILQPRRSAATPWVSGLRGHLAGQGATAEIVILENLRETYWAREQQTEYETAEAERLDAMLSREMDAEGCR